MSDFNDGFWSWYVAGITLLGILACLVLLWVTARKKVAARDDNTTGHVWDGDLREMNNPLPRWWMWLFVASVVFAFGYLALYPGLGVWKGLLGWSTREEYALEMKSAAHELEPLYAKFVAMPVEQMAGDQSAHAIGERLFMNNCAQCHGSDARGSRGFPNLADHDWLHGGSPEKIIETITLGRQGQMPPMAAAVGDSEDVRNLAHFVLSLSGYPHDSLRAGLGRSKFAVCAACHGVGGKGNQAIGAPNLTDQVWLHGSGEAAVVEMINHGKTNVMPAQADKLSEVQIRVLASYVWGLSNEAQAAPSPAK